MEGSEEIVQRSPVSKGADISIYKVIKRICSNDDDTPEYKSDKRSTSIDHNREVLS